MCVSMAIRIVRISLILGAAKCIDKYISIRNPPTSPTDAPAPPIERTDPELQAGLEAVVERMFRTCFANGHFKPAIGIAIESQRLDVVQEGIRLAGERQKAGNGKQAAGEYVDETADLMEFVL